MSLIASLFEVKESETGLDNIDELKQTIQYMNDNPTAMIYYGGGY